MPISGIPLQQILPSATPRHVAIMGDDYIGMRPTMLVQEGDSVTKGQALFEDKKNPGVLFTAPASGTVVAIHRGERRVLQSVVIRLDGTAKGGVIFSVADQFGIPIRYIGVGERIEDLRPFNAGDFIEALFARED